MRQAEWTVESAFGANPTSIAMAREFVREALQRHGLRHLVDDVRLVVSELSTNAMLHARTPFTVTLTGTREGAVLLTVRDGSPYGPARDLRAGAGHQRPRSVHRRPGQQRLGCQPCGRRHSRQVRLGVLPGTRRMGPRVAGAVSGSLRT